MEKIFILFSLLYFFRVKSHKYTFIYEKSYNIIQYIDPIFKIKRILIKEDDLICFILYLSCKLGHMHGWPTKRLAPHAWTTNLSSCPPRSNNHHGAQQLGLNISEYMRYIKANLALSECNATGQGATEIVSSAFIRQPTSRIANRIEEENNKNDRINKTESVIKLSKIQLLYNRFINRIISSSKILKWNNSLLISEHII
jgi:hypothetical protein